MLLSLKCPTPSQRGILSGEAGMTITSNKYADRAGQLRFDPIKEHRGTYFVEYQPPGVHGSCALLNLVFPGVIPTEAELIELLESELRQWLSRFPVPVMASAYDDTESLIQPEGKPSAFLVGWTEPKSCAVICSWTLNDLDRHLKAHPLPSDSRIIYPNVPFRTPADLRTERDRYVRERRTQKRVLTVVAIGWLVIIPLVWATYQLLGPEWVSWLVYGYALWQGFRALGQLTGYWRTSPLESAKQEKEQKMAHYYYHCELNPDGFLRLKADNFERQARERLQKEAAEVATKTTASKLN